MWVKQCVLNHPWLGMVYTTHKKWWFEGWFIVVLHPLAQQLSSPAADAQSTTGELQAEVSFVASLETDPQQTNETWQKMENIWEHIEAYMEQIRSSLGKSGGVQTFAQNSSNLVGCWCHRRRQCQVSPRAARHISSQGSEQAWTTPWTQNGHEARVRVKFRNNLQPRLSSEPDSIKLQWFSSLPLALDSAPRNLKLPTWYDFICANYYSFYFIVTPNRRRKGKLLWLTTLHQFSFPPIHDRWAKAKN